MQEQTTEALAVTQQGTATVVQSSAPFVNTLSVDTFEGKMATANALNNAQSLKMFMDTPLTITDVIQTPGIRKGRNGVPDAPCTNTYLVDADGKAYFSQSVGVARSAQMLLGVFPDMNKPQGLTLVCVEQPISATQSVKNLEIVQ